MRLVKYISNSYKATLLIYYKLLLLKDTGVPILLTPFKNIH